MKRSPFALCALCVALCAAFSAAGLFALDADKVTVIKSEVPNVAILDIRSTELDTNTSMVLSEILRTELFKLHVFRILERSMIQTILAEQKLQFAGYIDDEDLLKVGRLLSVDKLVVMTIGMMSKNIAINIRVINVGKATLDFTENVFVNTKESIIDAIKDIAKKIEVFYILKNENSDVGNKRELLKRKWMLLGANEQQSDFLITLQTEPDRYLEIRQYDITFTIDHYVTAMKNGWDPAIIKGFLKEGIPYSKVKKSLELGISDLTLYKNVYKEKGFNYDDYLRAYENKVLNVDDYRRFKDGYRRDRVIVGAGGAADSFPIANAPFKFLAIQLGWEHFWSENQRELLKYSMEMGFNLLYGFVPSPYFQVNGYIGAPPFYAKVGVGGIAEVILGGHIGLMVKLGVEVLECIEFTVAVIPTGTQPGVSYTDLTTPSSSPSFVGITFPYYGAFLSYKF